MLFRTVNKLLQKSHETRYPPSLSNALLADSFADFFTARLSWLTESVAVQLTKHVMTNHLDETFQSAYKEFRLTETAILRVYIV